MAEREYITLMHRHVSDDASVSLVAGTRSRLYCDTGTNWELILDDVAPETGCATDGVPQGRFRATSSGNIVFIAHSEAGFYTYIPNASQYEYPAGSGRFRAAEPVADLVALGITQAQSVCQVAGYTFIGNVVEEGALKRSAVLWGDFNDCRGWIPGGESLAGRVELGSEIVLALLQIDNRIRVYTNEAIWDGVNVGGDEVWRFTRRYAGPNVPKYPNAIVNLGDTHIWLGNDRIYYMGSADLEPRWEIWMDKASAAVFQGVQPRWLAELPDNVMDSYCAINPDACHIPVGGYDEDRVFIWFSWPSGSATVPDKSLVMCPASRSSCIVDSGFTCFMYGREADAGAMTLAEWLAYVGLCEMRVSVNEGYALTPPDSAPLTTAANLVAEEEMTPDFVDSDWNPKPCSELDCTGSFCDDQAEPLCVPCSRCLGPGAFLMATPQYNIVEYVPEYYARERYLYDADGEQPLPWDNSPDEVDSNGFPVGDFAPEDHPTTPGEYELDNYASLYQWAESKLGTENQKRILAVKPHLDSAPNECSPDNGLVELPWLVGFQAGSGTTSACLVWQSDDSQPVPCREDDPVEEGLLPTDSCYGMFNLAGSWLCFRFFFGSQSETPQCGATAVSAVTVAVQGDKCKWP